MTEGPYILTREEQQLLRKALLRSTKWVVEPAPQSLADAISDVLAHRRSWRHMLMKVRLAQTDPTDARYYDHEIAAFDRDMAGLEAAMKANTP